MLRIATITLLTIAIADISGCGSASSVKPVSQSTAQIPSFPSATPTPTATVALSSISPMSAVAGSPDVTLSVTGTNFVQGVHTGSFVMWSANGNETLLNTTFISSTELKAAVPYTLLKNPGTAQVFVESGDAFGITDGTSYPKTNSVTFTILPPSPTPPATPPPTPTPTPTPPLTPTPPPTPSPTASTGLSGNWTGTFSADMGPGHSVDAPISGPLVESGGNLAPTGLVLGSSMCFAAVLVRSGTISDSTVKMEMIAADFATIKFSGMLSADRLTGTFTIAGSECGSGTGTLSMTKIPSVSGNWAGTLRSDATKLESSLTVSLSQTSTILTSATNTAPFSISSLKATGVIQQAGTGCILQVFSTAPGLIGAIQGAALNLESNNDSTRIVLTGSVDFASTLITGTYKFVGTSCNGESGTFSLYRR